MLIKILGELPDLNYYIDQERGHWSKAAAIKKEWTESLAWQIKAQGIKRIEKPISILFINWFTKDTSKDYDNVVFAKKFLLDALVIAGVLPDDNRRYINKSTEETKVDAKNPRVEIDFMLENS